MVGKLNTRIKIAGYPFHIYFVDNEKDFVRICKRFNYDTDDRVSGGLKVFFPNLLEFVVYLNVKTPYILLHEIMHVSIDLFNYIGHDMTPAGSEPCCYMIQELYEVAMQAYGFKITKPRKIIKRKINHIELK